MNTETSSPSRSTLALTGLAILLFTLAGYVIFIKGSIIPTPEVTQPTPPVNQTQLVGLIRSTGLLADEQERLELVGVGYQLTELSGYMPGEPPGYYLLGEEPFADYVGSCVILKGEVPELWQDTPKDDAYGRSAFLVKEITPTEYADCSPYGNQRMPTQGDDELLMFEGVPERLTRPSPDIGYDYLLRLSVPYIDEFNASGLPQDVDGIVILPTDNTHWTILEEEMGKPVAVEGVMRWGYAESRHLEIRSIAIP